MVLASTQHSYSQWVKFKKKELIFLASEEKINVVFTYKGVEFNGDNLSETTFLNHIASKITRHQDTSEAVKWTHRYRQHKVKHWPEAFVSSLNKTVAPYKHAPTFVLDEKNARYTLEVEVKWMYFGYDIKVLAQPAKLTTELIFYRTDTSQIVSKLEIEKTKGLSTKEDFPKLSLKSMENCFERAAENLGLSLKKVLK